MECARYEHDPDLVANDGFEQPPEGSRGADVLSDEDGCELDVGAGGELGEALLGAVDFGSADQELFAQVCIRPGDVDCLPALVRSTATTERTADVGCASAGHYPGL